jgi:hypothetical protein
MTEEIRQFDTGAVRSADADAERYDLISPVGLRRLAETYAEGAKKYNDHNWLKGFPQSTVLNHALRHLRLYIQGDATEDHLAHAAWNLFAAMEFEETRPDLMDIIRRNKPQDNDDVFIEPPELAEFLANDSRPPFSDR